MDNTPLLLPVVTVQPSFAEVIHDVREGLIPSEKFWVSCYQIGEPSVHGRVHAKLDEKDRDLVLYEGADGIAYSKDADDGREWIDCPALGIERRRIVSSNAEYTTSQRITAFDVSPDGTRFAAGYYDGTVTLHPTSPTTRTPEHQHKSRPHLNTVLSLRFFPSSRVLLSSGIDFALHILPADLDNPASSSPVRSLRGHVAGVTSTAIIGRGRNVLSASLDASIKLWDVSAGNCTTSLSASAPVTALSLAQRSRSNENSLEVAEESQSTLYASLRSGAFEVWDCNSRTCVHRSQSGGGPLSAIATTGALNLLATGTEDGVVRVYDTRKLGDPITRFKRSGAGVEALQFSERQSNADGARLGVATRDGLPFVVLLNPGEVRVEAELVGPDCDPVRHIRVCGGGQGDTVWTACDDGIVRRYGEL